MADKVAQSTSHDDWDSRFDPLPAWRGFGDMIGDILPFGKGIRRLLRRNGAFKSLA